MNYALKTPEEAGKKMTLRTAYGALKPFIASERGNLFAAFFAIALTSAANLIGPLVIAHTIDTYIAHKNFHGVFVNAGILLAVFVGGVIAQYLQTMVMGGVGRRVLFALRNRIFMKLQELPVAFFNANKAGDLISRINNDTDKLNQFFSRVLMQFVGNFFIMLGAAIFLLTLDVHLGAAALVPAAGALVITKLLSGWIKRTSKQSLQSLGAMSAEIQESLSNFKVVVAFNRGDFFREAFAGANTRNYKASVRAGVASGVLVSLYGVAANVAQVIVLAYGIMLISSGNLTLGLLVGFVLYINNFYMPLRQLAAVWSDIQLAMASLERISEILTLESTMPILADAAGKQGSTILAFDHVFFEYSSGTRVLSDISFSLEKGKTYALVGPTGGGKTTTASLMARLYDPTMGAIYLDGRDIRSYTPEERAQKIGFILQEPFLFHGTIGENILYGNTTHGALGSGDLSHLLKEQGLDGLLSRFDGGLDMVVGTADAMSLGQKQIITFLRAVLRAPDILILDEATANIDTVTEQLLEEILKKLPKHTTKVVIAHRLNTIADADEIFFVNSGEVVPAGSFDHALEMLMHGKRRS